MGPAASPRGLAYPGDIIGFRSFLSNAAHKTEAQAVMSLRVCDVAGRCLPEIDVNHDRIIATARSSNKQRLFDLLHRPMLAHGQLSTTCMHMKLPLSRSDLAGLIGVQPETLSRLKDEGTDVISGRDIKMPIAL